MERNATKKQKKNKLKIVSIGKVRFIQKNQKKIIWERFNVVRPAQKRGVLPT